MPLSRIARTHLVYQFIILTLVFLGVGYYELLLERRVVMFLLIVPTFLYQLLVLSCCTELIQLPRWMDLSDSPTVEDQKENNGLSHSREDDDTCEPIKEVPAMSPEPNNLTNRDLKVCARKYKFRNWKASNAENSPLQSPVAVTVSSKNDQGPSSECHNSSQIQSPEPTKKYFFPYRQKRQWIDSTENSRPFKIRSWPSNISVDESSAMPTSTTSDLMTPMENLPDSSVPDSPESELTKRYTFPFRQKRAIESDDNEMHDSADLLPTPYWRTVGYSVAVKQEARRRRRSVSSSLLTTRQLNHTQESDISKDFSQSVEISSSPINNSKENPSKPASSTTFAKMKLGFVNCFSKIKRANSKSNLNKGLDKKRSFKSGFQSRENINLEPMEKEYRSNPKAGIEESNCDFYPSYIPFQKERFETDVRKRMLELPKN